MAKTTRSRAPIRRSYSGKSSTRRRSSSAGAQRLPQAAAIVARAAAEKIKQKRLRDDLGTILNEADAQTYLNLVSDKDYKQRRLMGRGKYTFGSFMRDAESIGRRATKQLAPWTRRVMDAGTNQLVSRISGQGRYGGNMDEQEYNDLFTASDKDDIVISNTEFLKTISPTSAAFQTQFSATINPGLSEFAPMLAQIAQYYEEYEVLQCVYSLKSTVVDGHDNAAGTVLMATQYNPLNALFTDDLTMDNYAHSSCGKVTSDILHGVECETFETGQAKTEYIRTGPVPSGQDAKTYDLARFQLATIGAWPDLQIGRLYVTYSVRLSKLKLTTVLNTGLYASIRATGLKVAPASLFGGSTNLQFSSTNITPNPITISGNVISFPAGLPAGKYSVSINLKAETAATITKTLPTLVNCSFVNDADGSPSTFFQIAPNNSQSSQFHMLAIVIETTGAAATATFAWSTWTEDAANAINVLVESVNSGIQLPNVL